MYRAQEFVALARIGITGGEIGLNTSVVATDGSQPVGRGIGPWLEGRDVLQVLDGDPMAPRDLKERALPLAGHGLEFATHAAFEADFRFSAKLAADGSGYTIADQT